MRTVLVLLIAAWLTPANAAEPERPGQPWIKLDVPYVGTPPAVVAAMLALAEVGPGDVVYDLGSGDGRIVIAAVRDRGAKRGVGIELNPLRIAEAKQAASAAGVSDRVSFVEGDIFTADFSAASVVTMYLWDNVNLRLRPRLLNELAPSTRIVSHQFHMFDWAPDRQEMVGGKVPVYFWIVPGKVAGTWRGEDVTATLSQSFQTVVGTLEIDSGSHTIRAGRLAGTRLDIDAGAGERSLVLSGTVSGAGLTGTVTSDGRARPIMLRRVAE
jgi:SAM-dependent methyltransferase